MLTTTFLALAVSTAQARPTPFPEALRLRIEQIRGGGAATIGGARLLRPDVIARLFEERGFQAAWVVPAAADDILRAIAEIERDGLTPADYHLVEIQALARHDPPEPNVSSAVDLQLLLTDAVAGLLDHVRYGKVRPVVLDRRWNVDPREGSTALDALVAEVAASRSPAQAIESKKPSHFIYQGLKRALGELRAIAAAGGWPSVPAGAALKPAMRDPRVAALRKRLAVTGELPREQPADPELFDAAVQAAVKRFQEHHRLTPDGNAGRATIDALNVPAAARVEQLRVNLERSRWVLGGLSDSFVLVNLPAFKAYLIRDRQNVWEARTQIGREARQTPAFRADMRYVVFNPDWTVPPTILAKDVLDGMRKGGNPIARKKLTILDRQGHAVDPSTIDWAAATPKTFPYTLRQPPGADNALGRVKFIFPNQHSIFLHDTPSRELFGSEQRTFSSGCIRVERPLELAAILLEKQGWTPERIQRVVDSGSSETVFLDQPLPVLIVYWTVSVGATGELRFARDVYNLDAAVLRALGGSVERTQP